MYGHSGKLFDFMLKLLTYLILTETILAAVIIIPVIQMRK